MSGLSAYEEQRRANIAANNAVLASLGLTNLVPAPPKKPAVAKKPRKPPAKRARKEPAQPPARRRVTRRSVGGADDADLPDVDEYESPPVRAEKPPDHFGEVHGFGCGSGWDSRADCANDLVHRAWVAGIVGTPDAGCYSIVLNGGYADDVDHGELLTYTGSGGRSLKGTKCNPKNLRTGPATHDQTLEGTEGRFNASLYKSFETGEPVRVIRGYKLDSRWAPLGIDFGGEVNYRYDGLYKVRRRALARIRAPRRCHGRIGRAYASWRPAQVEKAWLALGLEGYRVWKFALKRLPGQPELAVEVAQSEDESDGDVSEAAAAEAEAGGDE